MSEKELNGANVAPGSDEPNTEPTESSEDAPFLNKREAIKYFARTREIEGAIGGMADAIRSIQESVASLKPATGKPEPEPKGDDAIGALRNEIENLRRNSALNESLLTHQLKPSESKIVKQLFNAANPTDVDAWLSETIDDIRKLGGGQSVTQPAPEQVNGTTNSGTPGRGPASSMNNNPFLLSKEQPNVFREMGKDARREMVDKAISRDSPSFLEAARKRK